MEPLEPMRESIRVLVRVRPPLASNEDPNIAPSEEAAGSRLSTIVVDDQVAKLTPVRVDKLRLGLFRALKIHGESNDKLDKVFKFDRVFGEQSTQQEVFNMIEDTIKQVLDGYATTLLSYGPTFGGKSFTMVGTEKDPGIIPKAIDLVFHMLDSKKTVNAEKGITTEVEVSYVELHNKTFRNLLRSEVTAPTGSLKATNVVGLAPLDVTDTDDSLMPFTIRDDTRIDIHETPTLGVFLVGTGLRVPVHSAEETFTLLRKGEGNRLSRASSSVDGSTRSHAIITLFVESKLPAVQSAPEDATLAGHLLLGKLHLVDLAGGERVDISKPQGDDLLKAQHINKSLLAFGEVLHTLASNAAIVKRKTKLSVMPLSPEPNPPQTPTKGTTELHVPYLDNKLTHFLKDSLGGSTRTVLLTCVGPEAENYNVNLHCFEYAARAQKVSNLIAPIRVDIPVAIQVDTYSEISAINQLKSKLFEPMKSPRKTRRSMLSTPTPKKNNNNGSYTFVIHSLAAEDLPCLSMPFQPWIQAEVGSSVRKTSKQTYMSNFVKYAEEMTYEVNGFDLDAGIEFDVRVFVKPPFRRRKELGRARMELKTAFPVLEERTTVEVTLYHLTSSSEVFNIGRMIIDGSLRPSIMTKMGVFDPKMYTARKSFVAPPKPSELKVDPVNMAENVILTLRKVTTPDVVVLTDVDPADKPTPYTFSLEAKCLSESKKTPFLSGKVRFRSRELVANLCFEEPDVDYELSRSTMQLEELHVLVYSKNADQASSRAVGRAIFPLSVLCAKPHDEKLVEMSAIIKDVSGNNCGKMFVHFSLSPSGRNRKVLLIEDVTDEQTKLPRDLQFGWVKVNSVEAFGLNSLKLLGRSVRYDHLEGTPVFDALTKQDLLLVMEYGQKWVSHSVVITDQGDCCQWNDLDFRFLVSRENFLCDSVRISIFNRKLHGKESLLGSAILALQQFVLDPSLSIAHIPVKLRSAKNKVNGTLHINGIVIKDGGGEWIPGAVEKVHNNGRYDVRYDDGELESNIGKDFLRLVPQGEVVSGSVKIASIKTPKKVIKFPSGTNVEVKVGHDMWLPATVAAIRSDGSYDVTSTYELPASNFDEHLLRTVAQDEPNGRMKRSASRGTFRFLYGVGDKVDANLKGKGKWYKAKVWKTYTGADNVPLYDLDFASGEREIGVRDDRIRLQQQTLAPSSSFLATPQKSIFDVDPEDDPLDYELVEHDHFDEDDDEEVRPVVNLAELDFFEVPSSNLKSSPRTRGRLTSRGRSSRRSHSASFRSDDSRSASPEDRRSRSLSRHRLSGGGSVHSMMSSFSLSRSSPNQKSTVDLLREKAQVLVGDEVEVCLQPHSYHFLAALVEAISPDNLYTVRVIETDEVVENMPRDQIRLSVAAVEDQDRVYPFSVGDRIQANFRRTGEWLNGVIIKDRGCGVYDINYVDGRLETKVSCDFIRCAVYFEEDEGLKYSLGDKVEVKSEDGGYWYSARICKVRKDERSYDVLYSDGKKDIHVPERILRPGRVEDGHIPSIKPGFVAGDRVYVKSRSKAFGMEIKAFSEALHKSNELTKGLFGLMRTAEEEEACLQVKKNTAFKEIDVLEAISHDLQEYERLNPDILEDASLEEFRTLRVKFVEGHERAKLGRRMLVDEEASIFEALKDLKADATRASAVIRQREAMNYDFLSHRSGGLGDEELHALTVAIGGLKTELEHIEAATAKTKKIISDLSSSRHMCTVETKRALEVQKAGDDMLEQLRTASVSHPAVPLTRELLGSLAHVPNTHATPTHASGGAIGGSGTAGSAHVLGRYDSNRSMVDESAMDFGDIYEVDVNTELMFDPQTVTDHVDDLLGDIDRIDVDDEDLSGDEHDDEPEPDLRRSTSMGALLLAFKDLRCELTDQSSDSGHPTKRAVVKSARFSNSGGRPPSLNLRSMSPSAPLLVAEGPTLQLLDEEAYFLSKGDPVCCLVDPLPVAREGDKFWVVTFEPKSLTPPPPPPPTPTPLARRGSFIAVKGPAVIKGEDPRFTDAKRSLDDKKGRAVAAKLACEHAQQLLHQVQAQCRDIQGDCDNIAEMGGMNGALASKLGEEVRLLDKQIGKAQGSIAKAQEAQAKAVISAEEEHSGADMTLRATFLMPRVSVDERMRGIDDCKQAYVHAWSHWEEAKPAVDRVIDAYRNLYHTLKQKRDAIRHVHKLSSIFEEYKQERNKLLNAETEVLDLHAKVQAKNKELNAIKDQVDAEAATWEWYNKRVSDIGRRPYRRSMMSVSSSNLAPTNLDSPAGDGGVGGDRNSMRRVASNSANAGASITTRRSSFSGGSSHNLLGEVFSNPMVNRRSSLQLSPVPPPPTDGNMSDGSVNSSPGSRRPSGDFSSALNLNMNPVTVGTQSRPTTPRVQAERKSIQALQQKLTLNGAYFENVRIRSIEENKIEESWDQYHKLVTALIEEDYKVIKFEKRMFGSAAYYSTLHGGSVPAGAPGSGLHSTSSTYNLVSNLAKAMSSKAHVDLYSDSAVAPSSPPASFNNDNVKIMFTNNQKLLFAMMQDPENLSRVREHIEKALGVRTKALRELDQLLSSVEVATECCKQEQAAYVSAISGLASDPENVQTIKNIINAHRLHSKYQDASKTLLHTLLENNQEIENVEALNKKEEALIANSRGVCKDILKTVEQLQLGRDGASASSDGTMYHINNLLLQCEEVKMLIAGYQSMAHKCDDSMAGLDEALRQVALRRLEQDFKTNWEDDDYANAASPVPAVGASAVAGQVQPNASFSFQLATNTAANAGAGMANSSHNLLGLAPNSPLVSSNPTANVALNTSNYAQYSLVNGLYEEEIELLNKGIGFTRQRLEYLELVNQNLLAEHELYQQVHVQKEYLAFSLAHQQYKELDGQVAALLEELGGRQRELHQHYSTDSSELAGIAARKRELTALVTQKMRRMLNNKASATEFHALTQQMEELLGEAQDRMEHVLLPVVEQMQQQGGLDSIVAAYHRAKDQFLPDVSAALRAYEDHDGDAPLPNSSAAAGLGASSNNNSSYSLSNLYQSVHARGVAQPKEDHLYTVAALAQGAVASKDLVGQLAESLQELRCMEDAIEPLVPCHEEIQERFNQIYALMNAVEALVEREKERREYRTAFGKVFAGNEHQLIPNFTPSAQVKPDDASSHSLQSVLERHGGLQAVLHKLRGGVMVNEDGDAHTAPAPASELQLVDLRVPGSWQGGEFDVELSGDLREHLGRAKCIDPFNPVWAANSAVTIMKGRSTLKVLPRPASMKTLSRVKTAQNVKAALADNIRVPALVASFERKSNKSVAALLGEQSVWKHLNIREPASADPALLSLSSYAPEIKAVEDRIVECAARVQEEEIATEELSLKIEEVGDRWAHLHGGSVDEGDDLDAMLTKKQEKDDALYHQVVMSDEEIGDVLATFDSLFSAMRMRTVVVDTVEERSERRVEDVIDVAHVVISRT